MKCPKCRSDNPSDTLFCGRCGTKFDPAGQDSFTRTIESTTDALTRGTVLAGRYEIIEELGGGGMGRVYRAEDTKIRGEVALKIIRTEVSADRRTIERFRDELKTTRMISHRNVCRMFDLGEDKGTHFIAMEYVPGEDLKSFIRRVGQLPVGKAVAIAKQVCLGLAEAHRLGVVHRDLKPANIMIDKDGNAKIMDFGIARSLQAKGTTGAGVVIGTPEYMSPEQAEAKDVDPRSDIYSLGIILYEMLTGRVPFDGETPLSVAMKHKSEKPKNPRELNPQIPEALGGLILRCLEKDKGKRFQSAEEVRTELEKIDKSMPRTEAATKRPLTSRQITVTFGLKKLLIPATVVVAAIAAIWVLFLRPRTEKIATLPLSEAPILVALPAKVFGPAEFNYLTDAVPSALSTLLGQVEGLSVKVPPSSIDVDRVKGDLGIVADVYQVNTFVITSVTAESGRFYLDIKLADAKTHDQRWSKQFEGVSGQYLEMVRRAADEIRQYLRPVAPSVLTAKGSSENSEAELAIQRGRYFSNRYANGYKPEDFDYAMAAFKQAIQLDPTRAITYALIANHMAYKGVQNSSQYSLLNEIKSWAWKALDIDPRCGLAWSALACVEQVSPGFGWKKSLEFALKGAFFSPEEGEAQNNVFFCGQVMRLDILALQDAIRLIPFNPIPPANLAFAYCPLGRAEESLDIIDRTLQVAPDSPTISIKAIALIYLGRLKEVAEPLRRIEEYVRDNKLDPIFRSIVKHALVIQENDPDRITATLAEIRKRVGEMPASGAYGNYMIILSPLLARHGHIDLASYILEKGIAAMPAVYDFFDIYPDLRRIKEDPRCAKIRGLSRPRFEEALGVYIDARRRNELPKYLEKPLEEIMKGMNIKLLP